MFFTITHMLGDAEKGAGLLRVYAHDYPAYAYRLSREYAKALVDKYKHRRTLLLFADNRLNKTRQRLKNEAQLKMGGLAFSRLRPPEKKEAE